MLFPSQRRINTHTRFDNTQQRFDAVSMCKRAAATSSSSSSSTVGIPANNAKLPGQASVGMGWGRMAVLVPSFVRSLAQPPFTKRKIAILAIVVSVFLSTAFFASLYRFHGGFRRTVLFWKGMGPLVVKYKLLKFKATKWDQLAQDDDEYKRRITAYRQKSAPQLVNLILSLGGIYTKIAQVMSTIGQGLLPEEYIEALRPLQDGVPARNFDEISSIIEESTNQKMDDLFSEFDEKPIGAASIGQAHKAKLRSNGQTVVVKVQYPEVAELFEADLSNLEMATRLFAPENMEVAKALRKRHQNELDFNIEAENLRQCTEDMQEYGIEPTLVRIPRVYNVYGRNVLVMEYLKGVSLGDAIEEEQNRVAKALGKKDARELKSELSKRMREHMENGGGAGSGGMKMLGGKQAKMLNVFGPAASMVLRSYAGARNRVEGIGLSLRVGAGKFRSAMTGKGGSDNLILQSPKTTKVKTKVNLSRAIKTLVHVSGIQLMLGRSYNADPVSFCGIWSCFRQNTGIGRHYWQ